MDIENLEVHTFIGERDPSWGSPLLGTVPYIKYVDTSDVDKEAFAAYKTQCFLLEEKRREKSHLSRISSDISEIDEQEKTLILRHL